ncbi:hypothetical protein As57867_011899, partial [Aphanomyces stellatus]
MAAAQFESAANLGRFVEEELRKDASTEAELLPEGWILQLLESGHSPDHLPAFLESMLLASLRVAGAARYPKTDVFLRDLHAHHSRSAPRSGVCGYMFKSNDIAWNCRTCQMDDTCVLCQKCFQNSNHEGHEVFFHRTGPGGMCDCGDFEAWKPEGFCVDHSGNTDSDGAMMALPPPLHRTMLTILREFVRFITFVAQNSIDSFDDFKVAEKGDAAKRKHTAAFPLETNPLIFHTRISNDDVHTDEDLVTCLALKGFSGAFAEDFTHSVDATGCGMLKEDLSLADALHWMRQMKDETWFASVVDNNHLRHETAWARLFEYLVSLLVASTTVQTLLVEQLLGRVQASAVYGFDKVPIRLLLQATPHLKKELVKGMKELYLAVMGMKDLKSRFAPIYASVYARLMMQFFCGIGTERENVFGLGVQIFTTPSIVLQLDDDESDDDGHGGLWATVLSTLQDAMNLAQVHVPTDPADVGSRPLAVWNAGHMAIKYRRYFPLFQDLNHLLSIPTLAVRFAHRHARAYFQVLHDASHLNRQTRVPEHKPHVEREDNAAWVSSFTLCMHMDGLALPAMYKSLRTLPTFDVATLWAFGDALLVALDAFATAQDLRYGPHGLVSYSVASKPVSFHYPLHQAYGRFVLEVLHRDVFGQLRAHIEAAVVGGVRDDNARRWLDAVLDFPLRSFVWSSQVASNMWVRNGKDMMVRQVTSYYSLSSNHSFRDLDLVTIQSCLLLGGPARFIATFLDRYEIVPYLVKSDTSWLHKVSMEKRALYVAECLLKLLWIATELPPPPDQSIAAFLRRDVLHMILVKPHVFSHLRDQTNPVYCNPGLELTSDDTKNRELMAVLKEIADLHAAPAATQEMAPTKFSLKPSCYAEYDPSYYHVSPVNHVEAQVTRHEVVFKQWTPENELIPMVARLPAAHADALPCRAVLVEPELFGFVRLCLNDPLIQSDENVLSRIVHILTVQIYMLETDATLASVIRDHIARGPDSDEDDDDDDDDSEEASKRQKVDAKGPIHSQSILAHLTKRVQQYKAQATEASHKPLWSATLFVLRAYMTLLPDDAQLAAYLEQQVFPKKSDDASAATVPMDAKARLALQKKRQQEAMAKMMKQQTNFAAQLDDEDDDEMEIDEATDDAHGTPECIICAHVKKDDPIMYVGLLQKTPFRSRSTNMQPAHVGEAMHVQLCGHAVHLSCVQQYTATIRREAQLGLGQNPIAFDPSTGEFLCPLCKALCSTVVPYVRPPTAPPSKMEHFFQHALDVNYMAEWFTEVLPTLLQVAPSSSTVRVCVDMVSYPRQADSNHGDAIQAFAECFLPLLARDNTMEEPADAAQLVLHTIANVFHMSQLQGISTAFAHLVLQQKSTKAAAPLSLDTRLGTHLPSDAEALVDPFGPRDDAKMHSLFMGLTQLRDLFPSDAAFAAALPHATAAGLAAAPLLEQDLFATLLLVCSRLREKADMLWTVRVFCALHMTQVLLQCTQPVAVPAEDADAVA